jgi:hypothetical protein
MSAIQQQQNINEYIVAFINGMAEKDMGEALEAWNSNSKSNQQMVTPQIPDYFPMIVDALSSEFADEVCILEITIKSLEDGNDPQKYLDELVGTVLFHCRYAIDYMDDIIEASELLVSHGAVFPEEELLRSCCSDATIEDEATGCLVRSRIIDKLGPTGVLKQIDGINWNAVVACYWENFEHDVEILTYDILLQIIKYESEYLKRK